jgi:redox-sensitive bicupin YhaK (pirin superfamily)
VSNPILERCKLGFPWQTIDPFLFCAHHDDAYPNGNEQMGPAASLGGRSIGQDFENKDGWNMYHGDVVPGFPRHPHRGFETVTLARRGLIDHSDSLGATARFGRGDAQWMTAGKGVVHSEMFPLVNRDEDNHTELFQIWLNLPADDKMVEPHFSMLWGTQIPKPSFTDEEGKRTTVTVVAGKLGDHQPPAPPPHSWAARPDSDVAIWCLEMEGGAKWTLPPAAHAESLRMLYFYAGSALRVGGQDAEPNSGLLVKCDEPLTLEAPDGPIELLMLQGRPIGEPVAQYGPFVMNSSPEIRQAMIDYQRTQFGGWPWKHDAPVHARDKGRFAIHADGREEQAPEQT